VFKGLRKDYGVPGAVLVEAQRSITKFRKLQYDHLTFFFPNLKKDRDKITTGYTGRYEAATGAVRLPHVACEHGK
jgi:hypothetical protein